MSFAFDVLPSLVKTADGLYEFGKKIHEDFQDWQSKKDQNKLKRILTDIRNLVNTIDKIYSKLLLIDGLSTINEVQYTQYKEKFEKMYSEIQNTREMIYFTTELDYFSSYPELRDILYIKLGKETAYDLDHPEPKPELSPAENLEDFKKYVTKSSETTRKALTAMNKHLAENFD